MLSHLNFEEIADNRLRCARVLLDCKEWHMSCYMMGYALECVLKSLICKKLNLSKYSDQSFFKTHSWDRLLLLAGLSENSNFSFSTEEDPSFKNWSNWSEFTSKLQGEDWTLIRYKITDEEFDESTARRLYEILTNKENGIISVVKEHGQK